MRELADDSAQVCPHCGHDWVLTIGRILPVEEAHWSLCADCGRWGDWGDTPQAEAG